MARTAQNSTHKAIENAVNVVELQGGILSYYPMVINNSITSTGTLTVPSIAGTAVQTHPTTAAINSTATATAAQVATGYITSTSAASTSITFPTGTLLGTQLGATQGTVFELYVDNTAGANTVTMVVGTNAILSALAVAASTSCGLLTVPSGVTGLAQFTLIFNSATSYTITRTA